MTPSSLRIGNWIANGSIITLVTKLTSDKIFGISNRIDNEIHCTKPEGIALCGDILLRAGFQEIGETYQFSLEDNPNVEECRFKLIVEDSDFNIYIQQDGDKVLLYEDISELHELQNLVYGLTKKEIKINMFIGDEIDEAQQIINKAL